MKKIVYLCIIILLITGCSTSKKEFSIEGIIKNEENQMIGINYPITGNTNLDKQIQKYITNIRNKFKELNNNEKLFNINSELNIDYEYLEVGKRYYNVVLTSFINTNNLANPAEEIKTFVYDSKNNKFLTLKDIAPITIGNIKQKLISNYKECILLEDLETTMTESYLENAKYTFTDHSITLYFNPYEITNGSCGIIKYEIPYSDFKIEIETDDSVKNTFEYHHTNKDLDISKPTIALTFDDGPSKYTKEIVKLLEEYEANATFFILGNKVENYKETLQEVLQKGNELGNHSYNHKQLTNLSIKDLNNQINMTNQAVKKTLNYDIKLLRPTYGAITNKLRQNINMEIVLWNVDTKDWKLKNSKAIAKKALQDIKDEKIVLMHDIYKTTLEALKLILPELKKRGYQIVTVSELKEIQKLRNETEDK